MGDTSDASGRVEASDSASAIRETLETLDAMAGLIGRAASAYSDDPSQPGQDNPLNVFPNPKAPGAHTRADIESKQLDPDDEREFREAMRTLGPGRREDRSANDVGLHHGHTAVFEAGRPAKVIAEWELMQFNADATPGVVILTATDERVLKPDERAEAAKVLSIPEGQVGRTELGVMCQVAAHAPGFQPAKVERGIPFGYDMDGNVIDGVDEAESPFMFIGTLDNGNTPVYTMKITRTYTDESHQSYRQPDDRAKMLVIARLIQRDGGDEIGFYTSATYEPSRRVDAKRAELTVGGGMHIAVPSYGVDHLAAIRQTQPADPSIGQLAGEAYAIAERLNAARAELSAV